MHRGPSGGGTGEQSPDWVEEYTRRTTRRMFVDLDPLQERDLRAGMEGFKGSEEDGCRQLRGSRPEPTRPTPPHATGERDGTGTGAGSRGRVYDLREVPHTHDPPPTMPSRQHPRREVGRSARWGPPSRGSTGCSRPSHTSSTSSPHSSSNRRCPIARTGACRSASSGRSYGHSDPPGRPRPHRHRLVRPPYLSSRAPLVLGGTSPPNETKSQGHRSRKRTLGEGRLENRERRPFVDVFECSRLSERVLLG